MTPTVSVQAAGRTHVGLVRRRNEDAIYVGKYLAVVADGLGGHVAGDVASTTAVDTLRGYDQAAAPEELADIAGRAIAAANEALGDRIAAEPQLRGMGTTAVGLWWSGTTAVLAHIGDSRAYLHRGGQTRRLTEDHTFHHLVSGAGRVPTLPERISRFLDGRSDGRSADITTHELRPGDRYLLCSDGLSSYVTPERIADALADRSDAEVTAERLLALALDQGGPDNVTVAVVDAHDPVGSEREA